MQRLTTKQRFAFIFSIYFFFLLIVLCAIFLLIFNITASDQLRKELLAESTDIINNHLIVEKKGLIFKKDEEGASLKEYLITYNTAAMFMDSEKKILRTYGFFATTSSKEELENVMSIIAKNQLGNTNYSDITISWSGQKMKSLIVPLKKSGVVLGYMIIGKSLEEMNNMVNLMAVLFISLGIFTLGGSFLIGYLLARWAFLPLRKMIGIIENVDYDNLDASIKFEGNPEDELFRLSQKFDEMMLRLKDMSLRQKTFIANASHELKTPLTRAISSLELLSKDSVKNQDEIHLIRDDLFQINNLIERLLLLASLKKDIHLSKPRAFLIKDFFETLSKKNEQLLENKRLAVALDVPNKVIISIPREYFSIIFSNLFLNAIKYSVVDTHIYIKAVEKDGKTIISIEDEGVGMDEDEVKHMFDRFFRGKVARKEGYGIGLALVKQICDLYDVAIYVKSDKGHGTTISLHIPS